MRATWWAPLGFVPGISPINFCCFGEPFGICPRGPGSQGFLNTQFPNGFIKMYLCYVCKGENLWKVCLHAGHPQFPQPKLAMIFNGKGAFIAGEKSAYHPNVDRIPFPQGIRSLLEQAKSNSNSIQFIPNTSEFHWFQELFRRPPESQNIFLGCSMRYKLKAKSICKLCI